MKSIYALISLNMMSLSGISQSETLFLNPETNKVSVMSVVEFPGISKDEIYTRVNDWYNLKKNSIKEIEYTKKNDKEGKPQLIAIEYFNFDPNNLDSLGKNRQKLMYKMGLAQLKYGISAFGPKEMSGNEWATLVILIKDGKLKYEFTDFFHEVIGDGSLFFPSRGHLWNYEEKSVIISNKNWMKTRIEGVTKYSKFAEELVGYIKKPIRTNMDF